MDYNEQLLICTYQNAEMGKETTEQILQMTKDKELIKTLEKNLKKYEEIYKDCQLKFAEYKKQEKELCTMKKLHSKLMISIETLVDKSSSNIAKILIEGSTMGIVNLTKAIKEYDKADKIIIELSSDLLQYERKNVDELKMFL